MDNILSRRSIRKYQNKPVSDEIIKTILRAAMSAPSAGNKQPWDFLVIRDRKILDAVPDIHPYAKMVLEAPLAIIVCCDTSQEVRKGFWIQDCSAASQNILLAAHALGLGSVWCGLYPNEERVKAFQDLLEMPKEVIPFSFIPIGYPAEEKPPADRYSDEKVHYDYW